MYLYFNDVALLNLKFPFASLIRSGRVSSSSLEAMVAAMESNLGSTWCLSKVRATDPSALSTPKFDSEESHTF